MGVINGDAAGDWLSCSTSGEIYRVYLLFGGGCELAAGSPLIPVRIGKVYYIRLCQMAWIEVI